LQQLHDNKADFNVNVLDAMHVLRGAWDTVKAETIEKCFHHGGFETADSVAVSDEEETAESDDLPDIPRGVSLDVSDQAILELIREG
jgi:hypothetical protein